MRLQREEKLSFGKCIKETISANQRTECLPRVDRCVLLVNLLLALDEHLVDGNNSGTGVDTGRLAGAFTKLLPQTTLLNALVLQHLGHIDTHLAHGLDALTALVGAILCDEFDAVGVDCGLGLAIKRILVGSIAPLL